MLQWFHPHKTKVWETRSSDKFCLVTIQDLIGCCGYRRPEKVVFFQFRVLGQVQHSFRLFDVTVNRGDQFICKNDRVCTSRF